MTVPLYDDLDFQLNQALDLVLQLLAADPGTPAQGQVWFNTAADKIKYFDGTSVRTVNGVTKFASTIGDGATTSFNVAHNLGSTDVEVAVWELTGAKRLVTTTIAILDANTVTVSFKKAPAVNSMRVVVLG